MTHTLALTCSSNAPIEYAESLIICRVGDATVCSVLVKLAAYIILYGIGGGGGGDVSTRGIGGGGVSMGGGGMLTDSDPPLGEK